MILSSGIPSNSKSKTSCADSNLRLRCEASGTSKGLPRLRPRDEAKKSEIHRVGGGIEESNSYGSALWSLLDADLSKNVDATGESSVCSLLHGDKVRCPSATEFWDTV
ncbi:hypothetical protein AVEN_63141-1 [Araneus ventricosus]|uniref:Uncharacterized protein n=1 Tax=Araneus ventricosus TaxID=182803 RepID=A0A4Y2B2U6_ARAVE|nr:hypothetical protein AVEN_63141-1 [Araneus ventricosus]